MFAVVWARAGRCSLSTRTRRGALRPCCSASMSSTPTTASTCAPRVRTLTGTTAASSRRVRWVGLSSCQLSQVYTWETVTPSMVSTLRGVHLGNCHSIHGVNSHRCTPGKLSLHPWCQLSQVYTWETVTPSMVSTLTGVHLGNCHSIHGVNPQRCTPGKLSLHPWCQPSEVYTWETVTPSMVSTITGVHLGNCHSIHGVNSHRCILGKHSKQVNQQSKTAVQHI